MHMNKCMCTRSTIKICIIKHILIECRAFAVIRKQFFKETSLNELFENIKIDDILSFLRDSVARKNMTN